MNWFSYLAFLNPWVAIVVTLCLALAIKYRAKLGLFQDTPPSVKVEKYNLGEFTGKGKGIYKIYGLLLSAIGIFALIESVEYFAPFLTWFRYTWYIPYSATRWETFLAIVPTSLFLGSILFGFVVLFKGYEFLRYGGLSTPKLKPNYPPDIRSGIELPDNIVGVVSFRKWRCKHGMLLSVVMADIWKYPLAFCDYLPQLGNDSGIYAHRLTKIGLLHKLEYQGILGIVEQAGNYVLHDDGVVRSEICRILTVITRDRRQAELISGIYGVPVVICDNPKELYNQWLLTKEANGILRHNQGILAIDNGGVLCGNEG